MLKRPDEGAAEGIHVDANAAEESLFEYLRHHDRQLRTTDLMERAKEIGIPPAAIREAVWALVDQGRIAFTPGRKLRLCG